MVAVIFLQKIEQASLPEPQAAGKGQEGFRMGTMTRGGRYDELRRLLAATLRRLPTLWHNRRPSHMQHVGSMQLISVRHERLVARHQPTARPLRHQRAAFFPKPRPSCPMQHIVNADVRRLEAPKAALVGSVDDGAHSETPRKFTA